MGVWPAVMNGDGSSDDEEAVDMFAFWGLGGVLDWIFCHGFLVLLWPLRDVSS